MSYLTTVNPQEMWHGHEPTSPNSSQIGHLQLLGTNPSDGLCSDFQEIIRQQPEGAKSIYQDEGHALNAELDNDVKEPRSFIHSYIPTASNISSSNDLSRVISGGNGGSLSQESLSELENSFPYLSPQRHNQQGNSSMSNLAIPPTPNSLDMHCVNPVTYSQSDCQHQQAIHDGIRMQGNETDIELTPLVSPAVSPLEYQFNALGYSLAGAYLSPLSSPALQAQNDYPPLYDQRSSWVINSPILSADQYTVNEFSGSLGQNSDDKVSKLHSRGSFRVKKSPVVNQNRGTKGTNSFSQTLDGIDLSYSPISNFEPNTLVSLAFGNSFDDNINSPEILSNMAPHLLTSHNPMNVPSGINSGNSKTASRNLTANVPATPASLMKMTQVSRDTPKLDSSRQNEPDSINSKEIIRKNSNPHFENSKLSISTNSVSKIAERRSLPVESPVADSKSTSSKGPAGKSENYSNIPSNLRRHPSGLRGSKKRNGMLNNSSPALLPRPSPNFKPLIPRGGNELENSASILLASKSNYQNILDGTYFPGISYSSELSANLTSKRTSHKIAEQGRRNRMNTALQEIATLLPRDQNKDGACNKSGRGDRTGHENSSGISQSTSSKARTVEQAISYINYLKHQLEIANKKLEQTQSKKET